MQLRWEALFSQNLSGTVLQAQARPLQPPLPICHSLTSSVPLPEAPFPHLKEGNFGRCWFSPQGKGVNGALKWAHCLQCPYLNKKYKVLKRSVKVCLLLQLDHRVKVLVVDVSVNSEETLENCLGHWHEILWEWYAWKGENRCLILRLPGHVCLESPYNPGQMKSVSTADPCHCTGFIKNSWERQSATGSEELLSCHFPRLKKDMYQPSEKRKPV